MLRFKVSTVGNSMGILLPKEALAKLNATKKDTLYLIEGQQSYTITPCQQDLNPRCKRLKVS